VTFIEDLVVESNHHSLVDDKCWLCNRMEVACGFHNLRLRFRPWEAIN